MKAAFISVALVAVLARAAHVDERSNALHAQTVVVDHHNVHERDLLENIDLITAQDMEGTDESLLRGAQSTWSIVSGLFSFDWFGGSDSIWTKLWKFYDETLKSGTKIAYKLLAYVGNKGSEMTFPYLNFVSGYDGQKSWTYTWSCTMKMPGGDKRLCNVWNPPVDGEKMQVVSFNEFAQAKFNKKFPQPFFDNYYTGMNVPSWENNNDHETGVGLLNTGVSFSRKAGREPIESLYATEPRFAFDTNFDENDKWAGNSLVKAAFDGFSYFGPLDISVDDHASNGVWGIKAVNEMLDKYNTNDVLGILMTESVFSVHLRYKSGNVFTLDLSWLEKYPPIPGFASIGGKAEFEYKGGRLHTTKMIYEKKTYTDFNDPKVEAAYKNSVLRGWRFAEKAIIASLLAMTNLVVHVKDLHLELAATFQAVTVDAFSGNGGFSHPVSRMLQPYHHRSVQATGDNFRLLFDYLAADFSLAPLKSADQLQLMEDSINDFPLHLDELDMRNYGKVRNMDAVFSQRESQANDNVFHWTWHARALKVQELYIDMFTCFLDKNGFTDAKVLSDSAIQNWWADLYKYLPALRRTYEKSGTTYAHWNLRNDKKVDRETLISFASTIAVWVSWIHEDVGHAAASLVYNPVHSPMFVVADGKGIPLPAGLFMTVAYRGFVFLNRAKLLDDTAPDFWFSKTCVAWKDTYENKCSWVWKKKWWVWYPSRECKQVKTGRTCSQYASDKQCFTDFQKSLGDLGKGNDPDFINCDQNGFYSCVHRVETAVSS